MEAKSSSAPDVYGTNERADSHSDDELRRRRLLVMLLKGTKMTKHSNKKTFDRLFWISLLMDQFLWSSYLDNK